MRTPSIRVVALASSLALAGSLSACGGAGSAKGGGEVKSDCTPAHQFDTVKKGTLTVAFYDLPPFTKAEGGGISGVDGDLLKKIADSVRDQFPFKATLTSLPTQN